MWRSLLAKQPGRSTKAERRGGLAEAVRASKSRSIVRWAMSRMTRCTAAGSDRGLVFIRTRRQIEPHGRERPAKKRGKRMVSWRISGCGFKETKPFSGLPPPPRNAQDPTAFSSSGQKQATTLRIMTPPMQTLRFCAEPQP